MLVYRLESEQNGKGIYYCGGLVEKLSLRIMSSDAHPSPEEDFCRKSGLSLAHLMHKSNHETSKYFYAFDSIESMQNWTNIKIPDELKLLYPGTIRENLHKLGIVLRVYETHNTEICGKYQTVFVRSNPHIYEVDPSVWV